MDIVFRRLFPFAMFFNQSFRCRIVGIVTEASTWPKNAAHIQLEMTVVATVEPLLLLFLLINVPLRRGSKSWWRGRVKKIVSSGCKKYIWGIEMKQVFFHSWVFFFSPSPFSGSVGVSASCMCFIQWDFCGRPQKLCIM